MIKESIHDRYTRKSKQNNTITIKKRKIEYLNIMYLKYILHEKVNHTHSLIY